jgi:isoquinoline 1-oxidoreductase alpha subunit
MAHLTFTVNGEPVSLDVDPDTPLLWVLRDTLGLTGTKYSCGEGVCGACSVHIDGALAQSCITSVGEVAGRTITTIEGLAANGEHPLQQAWLAESVAQCGYCQPGQIMAAAALLATNPQPTDDDIDAAMNGNLCRCGTYPRIRRAIKRVAEGGA